MVRRAGRVLAGIGRRGPRPDERSHNKAGDFARAKALLLAVASRIEAYAGDDEALRTVVRQLRAEAEEFGGEMDVRSQKARHMASYAMMQNRTVEGKAKRGRGGRN